MEENVYNNQCFECGIFFPAKGKWNTICPKCEEKQFSLYKNSIIGEWYLTEKGEYFNILKEIQKDRKTPIYHLFSKLSKDEIGQIKWYGSWRKFCFFPNQNTIWDNKCLGSVEILLNKFNKEWKENKNGN